MSTATATLRSTGKSGTTGLTLDDLSTMTVDELDALYRAGSMPASFKALNGTPKGRMLAIRGVDKTFLFSPITAFSKLSLFPWDGKSFNATSDTTGDGINRINLLAQLNWFPFKTRIEPSVIDGKDCIYLDYEQPGNPFFIAKIRDELREVAPGLFLGPAMWKTGKSSAELVLWFAIDTTR
ncbi:MAG: hypothetical protein ACOY7J_16900 [Pseudomonadota bacterium]